MAPVSISRKAAAIGLVFAAAAMISAPAAAQEGSLTRSLLGILGLAPPEAPVIEYRERAPLVVPPTRDLPPPVAPDMLTSNPKWPDDATLRAERARAQPYISPGDDQRLSIDEIRAGRSIDQVRAERAWEDFRVRTDDEISRPLTPEEMQITHRSSEPAQGLTRRYLTDPPSSFLQPAPTN